MKQYDDKEEMILVPRIPTKEMLDAAFEAALDEDAAGVWRAMTDTASEQQADAWQTRWLALGGYVFHYGETALAAARCLQLAKR